jgi:hypothetical protein
MERIRHGLDITKEYLGHLKWVVEDKSFQGDLDKAGSIAAMISLGLKLYQQASEKAWHYYLVLTNTYINY